MGRGGTNPNTRGNMETTGGVVGEMADAGWIEDDTAGVFNSILDPFGNDRIDYDPTGYSVDESAGVVEGIDEWMAGQAGLMQGSTNISAAAGARLRDMRETGPALATAAKSAQVVPQWGESRVALHGAQSIQDQQMARAGQLTGLAGEFGAQARGEGPMSPEELQLRQQGAKNLAQQNAMAASARGGNAGAALYNAAQQQGQLGAATNAAAAQQRAQSAQQARANQMAAIQGAGNIYGQARGQGMEAAGLYSGQEQFGAGLQQQTNLANARFGQEVGLANAGSQNQLNQFLETTQGGYDQNLFGNQAGLQGQTLEGLFGEEGLFLEAEGLRKGAWEAPMLANERMGTAELNANADDGGGVVGFLTGLIGL